MSIRGIKCCQCYNFKLNQKIINDGFGPEFHLTNPCNNEKMMIGEWRPLHFPKFATQCQLWHQGCQFLSPLNAFDAMITTSFLPLKFRGNRHRLPCLLHFQIYILMKHSQVNFCLGILGVVGMGPLFQLFNIFHSDNIERDWTRSSFALPGVFSVYFLSGGCSQHSSSGWAYPHVCLSTANSLEIERFRNGF